MLWQSSEVGGMTNDWHIQNNMHRQLATCWCTTQISISPLTSESPTGMTSNLYRMLPTKWQSNLTATATPPRCTCEPCHAIIDLLDLQMQEFKLKCSFDVREFPFDSNTCQIKMESWLHNDGAAHLRTRHYSARHLLKPLLSPLSVA